MDVSKKLKLKIVYNVKRMNLFNTIYHYKNFVI